MATLQQQLSELKKILLRANPPEHFSAREIVSAFIISLIVGVSFVMNTLLFKASESLTAKHLILIIFATIILLTVEIYYVGYERVRNKVARPFCQFWLKRFLSFYSVSIIASFLIVYLFGIDMLASSFQHTLRIVIAASLPCAIGTALSDLVR